MGYFSSGTEGLSYEEQYCRKCVHYYGCTVWLLHLNSNNEECNNEKSPLHVLIPRSKDDLSNEKCTMFHAGVGKVEEPKLTTQEKRRLELEREYLESKKAVSQ